MTAQRGVRLPGTETSWIFAREEESEVNRTVAIAAGVALALVAFVGSHASAQGQPGTAVPPVTRPATPQTKIALLNLTYVVKGYKKYQTFQNELKAKAMQYETGIKDKAARIETLTKEASNPATEGAAREAKEKEIRDLKRQIEDVQMAGRTELEKFQGDMMVQFYKEVRDASQRHALANGFELVFHYNDATTQADYDSPANINRKMNSSGLMPFYWAPGMDISAAVLDALNQHYKPTGAAPVTPVQPK